MIFLMDFEPKRRCLHAMKDYGDRERLSAQDKRLKLALAHLQAGMARDVALLTAADEDCLRRTHARHFEARADSHVIAA